MRTGEPGSPGFIFRKPFDQEMLMCNRVLRENPHEAATLSSLAHTCITLWCYGFVPHAEAIPEAQTAVLNALEIDNRHGPAHVALGLIKESLWQWAEVEDHFKSGIEYAPEDASAYNWYSNYLYANSRFEEAYEMAEKAIQLSSDPGYRIGLGAISYFCQDFDRLKREMLGLIAEHPDYAPAYDWLGMAYIQLKEYDLSIESYEKARLLSGDLAEILGGLGHAYGIAGNYKEAKRILEEMQAYAHKFYVPPVQIAFVHAGLGEVEQTFGMLERAYREKSWELIFIRTEPWFEHLHKDQRFRQLINRLDFPELI